VDTKVYPSLQLMDDPVYRQYTWRPRTSLNLSPSSLYHLEDVILECDGHGKVQKFPTTTRPPTWGNTKKQSRNVPMHNPQSFVALSVNVGGSKDPPSHFGMAHFCEHMVHYGSKEFPEEDAYFKWIFVGRNI
jgi:hypothetical protein